MNIALFTPVNTKSAIAHSSFLLENVLLQLGHTLSIVRTEDEASLSLSARAFRSPISRWTDSTACRSVQAWAELVVYQVGDNLLYHKGAAYWIAIRPGLVILHDFFLADLFLNYMQNRPNLARKWLSLLYGTQAPDKFYHLLSTPEFYTKAAESMPLTEWICSQATAVLTHSDWGVDRVLNSCPGPVRTQALLYERPDIPVGRPTEHSPLRIATIGCANRNKRFESIIRSIGSSPLLKSRVEYRIVGAGEPEFIQSMQSIAQELGVSFSYTGWIDDSTLRKEILQADIVTCLRFPTLEATSASCIEALLYGKPSLVTDVGFYRELPNDCVVKIAPDNEHSELTEALTKLATDAAFRRSLGERGKAYAEQTFTAESYAAALMDLACEANNAELPLDAARNLCDILHEWGYEELSASRYLTEPMRIFEFSEHIG